MKYLIIFFLIFSTPAFAEDIKVEIEKMLQITDMATVYENMINEMLDSQLKAQPTMIPYRKIFYNFLTKYIGYENLKPELIRLYSQSFTVDDIRVMNLFYSTPTGKKSMKLLPTITTQASEWGRRQMDGNMKELERLIKEEADRIK